MRDSKIIGVTELISKRERHHWNAGGWSRDPRNRVGIVDAETEYFNDVECRACRKIIEENRPDNLLDGDAPKYYYYSKTYAKKMRKADLEQKEFNDKYGVCDCGCDLVIRTNTKDKKQFLGCSSYPKCKKTKNI